MKERTAIRRSLQQATTLEGDKLERFPRVAYAIQIFSEAEVTLQHIGPIGKRQSSLLVRREGNPIEALSCEMGSGSVQVSSAAIVGRDKKRSHSFAGCEHTSRALADRRSTTKESHHSGCSQVLVR